ncbi:MAG: LuxR C-terminal-related transcriptional regulator [Steroidobacteraceae bacterium]|nr:LuxR C-terminal-related transcriptional regulator [Steroidobacteraceae bacterium]
MSRTGQAGARVHDAAADRRLSALILELYREARERDARTFCDWALRRAREVVAFDSAMWGHGNATAERVDLFDVHLVDQPASMLQNYARVQQHDFLARAVGASPHVTVELYSIISREAFVRTPMYRRHARRFGMENLLCTGWPESPSGLLSVISFWRAEVARRFSEAERATTEFLVPHLVEARRLSVLGAMQRRVGIGEMPGGCVAVCDQRGVLHEAEEGFVRLVASQWPSWHGPALPEPLATALRKGRKVRLAVGELRFEWAWLDRRLLVGLRRATAIDRLSARERAIVERVARGGTAKLVARELRLQPTTVRNHLASAHRKLGVSNRAQLVRALVAAGWPGADRGD